MKAVIDTSVIIDVDRRDADAIALMKKLTQKQIEVAISTVTLAEYLTGVFMNPRPDALQKGRELITQFSWIAMDAQIAEKTAFLLAEQLKNGRPVDFQDTVIASTFFEQFGDILITKNKKHFYQIPPGKCFSPKEYISLKEKK